MELGNGCLMTFHLFLQLRFDVTLLQLRVGLPLLKVVYQLTQSLHFRLWRRVLLLEQVHVRLQGAVLVCKIKVKRTLRPILRKMRENVTNFLAGESSRYLPNARTFRRRVLAAEKPPAARVENSVTSCRCICWSVHCSLARPTCSAE